MNNISLEKDDQGLVKNVGAIIEKYFLTQNCPVCENSNSKVLYKKLIRICNVLKKSGIDLTNEEVPAEIMLCKICGHKYSSLILKDEVLKEYYFVEESEYYDKVKEGSYQVDWKSVDETNQKLVNTILKFSPPNADILEIGCGMGRLIYQLKQHGCNCYGVEPSKYASQFAVDNFNLDIVNGFLDYQTYPGKKFDVIVLSDVVEHISNINALVELISFYLSANGKLVVLTGNSNSLYSIACGKKWLYYYSWEHISFFNRRSVDYLFNKNSLHLDYFEEIAHSPSAWQNIKILVHTAKNMAFNLLRIRKSKFYFMAFDHFIAVTSKIK